MKRVVVIMAGGSGERFYPLSRMKRPKQLLPLISNDKLMLEQAIERVEKLIPKEDVFIITSSILQHTIRETLSWFPAHNVVAEPAKRNTAPCLALAASLVAARYSETHTPERISVAVITADHFFSDDEIFRSQIDVALSYAEQNPVIVTMGITPTRPETGYGYIEVGSPLNDEILEVVRFREKPNYETACEFIESGNFLWNSGMFFYRCDTFINGMQQHLPEVGNSIATMATLLEHESHTAIDGASQSIQSMFELFPDVSIDYALMERADNVVVIPSKFEWDDVGSWDSLDRTNPLDSNNNVKIGDTIVLDSENSIIANYCENNSTMLSVVGMDNVVVIATKDSIVVCPKDKVQDVKRIVAELRKQDKTKFI